MTSLASRPSAPSLTSNHSTTFSPPSSRPSSPTCTSDASDGSKKVGTKVQVSFANVNIDLIKNSEAESKDIKKLQLKAIKFYNSEIDSCFFYISKVQVDVINKVSLVYLTAVNHDTVKTPAFFAALVDRNMMVSLSTINGEKFIIHKGFVTEKLCKVYVMEGETPNLIANKYGVELVETMTDKNNVLRSATSLFAKK